MELQHLLADAGFRTVGMFDDKELAASDLTGPRLYLAAAFAGGNDR